MANRHKNFKKGGKVMVDNGPESVVKEAKERKSGGDVKVVGHMAGGRLDRRARGGGGLAPEPHKGVKDVKGFDPAKSLGARGPVKDTDKKVEREAKSKGNKSPFSSAGGGSASTNPYITSAKAPR